MNLDANIALMSSKIPRILLVPCLIFHLILAGSSATQAQSAKGLDQVQTDKLTNRQVEDLIIKAESLGVSDEELFSLARQRGMPESEVNKLENKIRQINLAKQRDQSRKPPSKIDQLRKTSLYGQDDLFQSIKERDSLGYELTMQEQKVFGFSLFQNKNLDFSPNMNMPTPQNYILGPGDEVVINIYGGSVDNFTETINPEGKINIRLIGLVHLSGLTVEAARAFLGKKLANYYSGLRGTNPTTFLSVSIGNIRTIKVNIVGEVQNPGTFTLSSVSSVFNALYIAGGPTIDGTFRHIQVYRNGALKSEVDIYKFLTKGNDSENITLEDNDVVLVRPIVNRVEIQGAVRLPGVFEMKSGETLQDLIYYSGGFNEKAFKETITVTKISDQSKKVGTLSSSTFDTYSPMDGDIYLVGEIEDRFTNRVQISGAVVRPGQYELTSGMSIRDLVDVAGGTLGDAHLKRVTLYRTMEDFTLRAQSINLGKILSGEVDDVELQNEDLLSIPSLYDLREEYYVEISGEVNREGLYPYAENLTVGDLILKAGGLKESASLQAIEIARRIRNDISGKTSEIIKIDLNENLSVSDAEKEVILLPFDHIFIRRSPGYQEFGSVRLEGEVFYPGEFALENVNMRISDLISRAGGLNEYAYAKGATLLRRTEFFEEQDKKEKIVEELTNLQNNTTRSDVDNPEAERLLLDRVNSKIKNEKDQILEDALTGSKDDQQSDELTKQRLLRTQINQKEIKESELVGINLDLIIKNPKSKYDLILQEGDLITIPKELQTVRLRGEVLYPTTTRYERGLGVRNYVGKAGGFSENSSRKRSYVVYANGDVQRTKHFLAFKVYPRIEPGSEIIIPLAPVKRKISAAEVISLSTSLLFLYSLINQQLLN